MTRFSHRQSQDASNLYLQLVVNIDITFTNDYYEQ